MSRKLYFTVSHILADLHSVFIPTSWTEICGKSVYVAYVMSAVKPSEIVQQG